MKINNFLHRLTIISLLLLEFSIIYMMLVVFYPVPIQKVQRGILNQMCSYGARHYYYSFGPMLYKEQMEISSNIIELNKKLGFMLFSFSPNSHNKIYVVQEIKGNFSFPSLLGETIGLTYCSSACCGKDNFKIEFKESEFYDNLKVKLLVLHELGHVVGLMHDDSKPAIMNTYALSPYEFTLQIEEDYIHALKERMGIK